MHIYILLMQRCLRQFLKVALLLILLFSHTSSFSITVESVSNFRKDKVNFTYQKVHEKQQLHFVAFPLASSPSSTWADPSLPETFILKLVHGQAFSSNGHIIFKNQLIKELIWPWGPIQRKPDSLNMAKLGTPKRINGKVAVIAQEGSYNYYHWVTEILPKIALLEAKQVDYDWLYVPKLRIPFMRETLEKMKIDLNKLIEADVNTYIEADELIIPSFVSRSCYSPRWVVDFLRERLSNLGKSSTKGGDKSYPRIYISRAKGKRKITNEDEVFGLLEKEGFVKICLEDLKVEEQIQLFKQAEIIVAAHGAGLTNIIFCKPKTKIFEIFQELKDDTYWYLSQVVGLQHKCIKTVPFKERNKSVSTDTSVSLGLVKDEIIKEIK